MNDTTAVVKRYVRERYARLSGADRLLIGAQMFETARTFALASIPHGVSEQERRRRLCERFYGSALAAEAYPRECASAGRRSLAKDRSPDLTRPARD